jgi:hypothetical protein
MLPRLCLLLCLCLLLTLPIAGEKAESWAFYIPEDGIMFCPIPKTACAEWKRFFRWMGGLNEWSLLEHHWGHQGDIPIIGYNGRGEPLSWKYSLGHDLENIRADSEVTMMMAVRPPHVRLLSAFGQKCVRFHNKEYGACSYLEHFPSLFGGKRQEEGARTRDTDAIFRRAMRACKTRNEATLKEKCRPLFEEFVDSLSVIMEEDGQCSQRVNRHERPSSCFCNAWQDRERFTFLPFPEMVSVADTTFTNAPRMSEDRKAAVHKFLHERMDTPQDTKSKITHADALTDVLLTEETLSKIKRFYDRDYELLALAYEAMGVF